jgi:hypothetical protein
MRRQRSYIVRGGESHFEEIEEAGVTIVGGGVSRSR